MTAHVMVLDEPRTASVQTRAAAPFSVQLSALQGRYATPWREPSIREALGVPAILRCVTLISNTAGALSVNAFRDGQMVSPDDRPRLIVRPNPLTTARAFFRDTAFHKATRGESWWWVAKRDSEGRPLSLFPVPPWEVKVEANVVDPRYPHIYWRDQKMPNADMVQDMLMPDPDNPLRGAGPLQLCGAAVSVAVESQEWAANFFAEGGYASVVLKSDVDFDDEDDATKLKSKWTATAPNTPHVLSPGLEVDTLPVNEQGSQMLAARVHNFGEAALMYGIPGSMVEYVQSGGSLTYQNVGQRFDDFVKGCLWPNYLEGTEQSIGDLLPRTLSARFDVDAFTRPDPKTRYEIHAIAIDAGIYDVDEAKRREGLISGSIETAPIPDAPTSELPPPTPLRARSAPEPEQAPVEYRCDGMRLIKKRLVVCGKLLAESGSFVGTCPRCKKEHAAAA